MTLRQINSFEVNKQIKHLPDNIYGYSYGFLFSSITRRPGKDFSELVFHKRNPSESERRLFFEVKKFSSLDVRLVGYISDETQLIYNQKGLNENEIIIFPYEYQNYKNQIEMQLIGSSITIVDRTIELDDVGELTILEVSRIPVELAVNKANNPGTLSTSSEGGDKITEKYVFVKQLLLQMNWSFLIVFIIILFLYKLFGLSPKDLMP